MNNPVPELGFPNRVTFGIKIVHDEEANLRVMGYEMRDALRANRARSSEPLPFKGVAADRRLPQLGHLQSGEGALQAILLAPDCYSPDVR
jgi:hypothetical protein